MAIRHGVIKRMMFRKFIFLVKFAAKQFINIIANERLPTPLRHLIFQGIYQ
jgi:hypothetical protein